MSTKLPLLYSMFGLAGTGGESIGAKPNLYREAIELVCGGSPKICVLVETHKLKTRFDKTYRQDFPNKPKTR